MLRRYSLSISTICFAAFSIAVFSVPVMTSATDWPEWRGAGRTGIWTEEGILDTFAETGLEFTWRVPVHHGYAGPAVADGRVFVTDFEESDEPLAGTERVLALNEETGEILWTHTWEVSTRGVQAKYANGPRATPTVDGDRVYVLGMMGDLFCLNVFKGEVLWQTNYGEAFNAILPMWGMSSPPLVEDDLLICLVGGDPDALVVAFNKLDGEVAWRSGEATGGPGYAPPVIIESGGARQLIAFHPTGIHSMNPETGDIYWEKPYKVSMGQSIPTPIFDGSLLSITSASHGIRVYEMDDSEPGAMTLWGSTTGNKSCADGLHSFMSTPYLLNGYVYGVCGNGQLRGLNALTGERLWATQEATEDSRIAEAFLVRQADRFFINNDRGELIIAKLTPKGYEEISRTKLIKPTNPNYAGRSRAREFGAVNWTHPAYANGHIVHRNDEEIVRASLLR